MLSQAGAVGGIVLLAFLGLAAANFLHDRGVDESLARFVPAVLGGAAFLVAAVWLDVWTAVGVSAALSVSLLALRLGWPRLLRGVRGETRRGRAAIAYGLAGTLGFVVGWGLLGDRWLALVPIAFMAWGDGTAGLVRGLLGAGGERRIWPSVAMLAVCLAVAALFQPYWVGALGGVVATAVERFRPMAAGVWDDNWAIVPASLAVMYSAAGIGA